MKSLLSLTAGICLSLVVATNPVLAGKEGHDKPRHGGMIAHSKTADLDLELVLKPGVATLYVSDHGKPMKLSDSTAKLVLLSGSAKSEHNLVLNGDKFEAKGDIAATKGTKAVVSLQLKGKPATSVRYEVK